MAWYNTGEFIFALAIPIWCKDHNAAEAAAAKYVVQGIIEMGSLIMGLKELISWTRRNYLA